MASSPGPVIALLLGMLDTAIVGGGLSGLALASLLCTQDIDCRLFEARERLGGRALTVKEPPRLVKDGRGLTRDLPRQTLDLGPTWFWPAENPHLVRLLGALGIATFDQYETGRLVFAPLAGVPPRRVQSPGVYASAQRIVGGVGAVVDALAGRIGAARLALGHELVALAQRADCVELTLAHRGSVVKVQARRVVLAMPPRLLNERVEFTPRLSPDFRAALAETPTWMASHAKALAPFSTASWRTNGDSGAALSPYPGAVLAEVFDACDANGQAALGGFVALSPREREAHREDLARLVHDQLTELFGPLPEESPLPHIQDWATERFTAAALDLEQPALEPTGAPALTREPLWCGRLFVGGAETAVAHPGHMEGALEVALRIAEVIIRGQPTEQGQAHLPLPKEARTEAWLQGFRSRLQARRVEAAEVYRDVVQRALSAQDSNSITQRALLQSAASAYRGALSDLASAPFLHGKLDPRAIDEHVEAVIAPLAGLGQEILGDAMKSNQTSCAMRAFPDEVRPDSEYMHIIRADLKTVLEECKRRVEAMLNAPPPNAA